MEQATTQDGTPGFLSKFKVELATDDWAQFHWRLGLRRIPAVLILLTAAGACHAISVGVLAAGTALSVGFAPAHPIGNSRTLAMTATACAMTVCGFVGIVTGNSYPLALAGAALGGFVFAYLALGNEDTGWIAMQGVLAFLIGAYYPGSWALAGGRAGCILLGGTVQTLSLSLIWHLEGIGHRGAEPAEAIAAAPIKNSQWLEFLSIKPLSWPVLRFSLRVAATLALAVELDHLLQLKNGYWLPMTTLVVLKPDFSHTYSGAIQRVVGTLAGVVLASLITKLLHPNQWVLIGMVAAFCWSTFSTQKVNAVMFSTSLTVFVVLLIALTGLPESEVVWHRFINTLMGCTLALTSYFAGIFMVHRAFNHAPEAMAAGSSARR
jgi:hypothetical protein